MPAASNLQTSFLGGEISQSFQGRYDRPDYKISLVVCLNAFPIETGAWTRRGGTQFCQTTRGGAPGRVLTFDVTAQAPMTLEFTDNFVRFFSGPTLITTNDAQIISSISTANPAVVTTVSAHGWSTGNTVLFQQLGINNPLLQNRAFKITVTGGSTFSIADAVTGININGSTLGAFVSGKVARVLELATNFGAGSWSGLRVVQAETQALLLGSGIHSQIVTMTSPSFLSLNPTFTIANASFIDGPYYDPYPGSIITSWTGGQSGNLTLTLGFQTYDATRSYSNGDFVTSAGQGYKSLIDANLNNTPASSPTDWLPVNAGAPVSPNGFTGGDIGRHIRLFSEPPIWAVATAYVIGNVVKFNGAYFQAVANNTGVTPGTDATKWAVVSGAAFAVWTWGKITAVTGVGLISPGATIGSYTNLAQAFDGTTSQTAANSASQSSTVTTYPQWNSGNNYNSGDHVYYNGNLYQCSQSYIIVTSPQNTVAANAVWLVSGTYYKAVPPGISSPNNVFPPNQPFSSAWTNLGVGNPSNTNVWTNLGAAQSVSVDAYAGLDNHLAAKAIDHATVYPSSDQQFGSNVTSGLVFNLRASNVIPATPSNGTLLGTTGLVSNTFGALTILSNDNVTAYGYAWVEMTATVNPPLSDNGSHTFTMTAYLSQAQFFQANVSNGSVVTIQLVGTALLYPSASGPINTWRAGLYSDAAGWPSCGTYSDGRLWLGGVIGNHFDASMSNAVLAFSPTGPDGTVAGNNAIALTFNAPDVNPILWMKPDLQGVLMGTQRREFLVFAPATTSGIGPTNIAARITTQIGSAAIEPVRGEHTLLFVHRRARKIVEYFSDVFSGKFTAPNLLEKARHLSAAIIKEIAYVQEITPAIWARCVDGSFFGLTYKRDTLMTSQGPTFIAPHRHTLGSGRLVESICSGPSQLGTLDSIMMVTNDPTTGVRHVELLTDFAEETALLQNAWQLDDAVTPTSYQISGSNFIINGLWHLNGKTVQVFAGGIDLGAQNSNTSPFGVIYSDFTVANGSLTIPFGDGVSGGTGLGLFTAAFVNSFVPTMPIVVGFTFNSDGQRVRPMEPQESGSRSGPALGKRRRADKYGLQVVNSTGISIGTDFQHLDAVYPETDAAEKLQIGQPYSGVVRDALDDKYSFDSQMCWRISRPWPAMITAAGGFINTSDE